MKTYEAVFTRDGNRWLVRVKGVAGCHTQALNIDQGLERIREALSLFDEGKFEVNADIRLPTECRTAIVRLRKLQQAEIAAHDRATQAQAQVARALTARLDLTMRDAGSLMGISHSRINQLMKAAAPKRR